MPAISAGQHPRCAAFCSSNVHTRSTLCDAGARSMPSDLRYVRSTSTSRDAMYALVGASYGILACGQNSHSKHTSSSVCGSAYPWSIGTRNICVPSKPPPVLRTKMFPALRSVFAMRISSCVILCTSCTGNSPGPSSSASASARTKACRDPSFPVSFCSVDVAHRFARDVAGTAAKDSWSRRYAATSRDAPSPTRVPLRNPSPAAFPTLRPRGLFLAFGSSSAGLNTAQVSPSLPFRKYAPPVPLFASVGRLPIARPRRARSKDRATSGEP
mmetsp:Transcript_5088/g.19040  ORF Transcript_5088/g.19040 Transcript_5088/m.19040 type:complete len:271 (-) Transcript_5088:1320-2132(-)